MDKKGIFFTAIVIALFLVLFFLSQNYLSRVKNSEWNIKTNIISDQVKFVEDSIVYEYYNKIIDLKPGTIERKGEGQIQIDFPNAGVLPTLDNKTEMVRLYRNYTEGRLSQLSNANVTLINFYPNFTIIPYGSVFMKEGNNLTFYNFNYSQLKKVTIELKINESVDDVDETISPSNSGTNTYPEIKLKIKDKGGGKKGGGGEEIIESEVHLDPTIKNSFFVNFTSGGYVRVDFGYFNNNNGTFITSAKGLQANITLFEVRYVQVNQTVKAIGGNFTISKLDLSRNSMIVIASE
ncbi:hypothetical protein HY500_01335 [Candidatus Woesearchaeota archaeon]|nr:hypothetical protein [Candidatus Woesearchaeota archaeon]